MKTRFLLPALLVAAGAALAQAPSSFDDCDRLVLQNPDRPEGYRCYVAVAGRTNGWDDAARRLGALTIIDPENHLAKLALASVEARRGQARAEDLYLEAIAAFTDQDETENQVAARLEYSTFLAVRGRSEDSGEQLQAAMNAAVQADDAVLAADVSVHLARVEYYRAQYEAAEQRLMKVRDTLFRDGDPYRQAMWLGVAGSVRWGMGRFHEALQDFQQQADLLASLNDPFEEAVARSNIVLLATKIDPPEAGEQARARITRLLEKSLQTAIRGGNRAIEGKSELYLGQLVEEVAASRRHLERGLLICRAIGDLEDAALASRLWAESLVRKEPRDPERGLELLAQAVALAEGTRSPQSVARTRMSQATMLWNLYRNEDEPAISRDEAIRTSMLALDAIEAIRDSQTGGTIRARTFSPWVFFYKRFIGNLLWPPERVPLPADLDLAFRIAERMRARVFLDALDAAHADKDQDDLPWSGLPRIADVQGRLRENEAVLSFLVEEQERKGHFTGGSWLTVITRKAAELHRLPVTSELAGMVDLTLGSIRNRDGSERAGLARLYRVLLQQALDDLPEQVDHLVIVPDGPLHRLPFGALVDERFHISRSPSMAAWLHWTGKETGPPGLPASVWIDPAIGFDDGDGQRSVPLGRLPYAVLEGQAVRQHLGSGVQIRSGMSATEHRFKSAPLNEYAIVHLAAHGLVDDLHPDHSGIALAPGEDEDGLLQVREIVDLDLTGRVVVLSACRSASGAVLEGEGVLSLARAFFVAGAQGVVANLWPVKDDEAAAFSAELYRHLGDGNDLATALASARTARIGAGEPAESWAGTVLIGNGRLLPLDGEPRESPWSWLHLALFAGIVAVVAVVRGRSLRRNSDQ